MFLDSDHEFLADDVVRSARLLETNSVVCGVYAKKSGGIASQPKDIVSFYRNKEGELLYGSTGFMMISYDIVEKIAGYLQRPISTDPGILTFPFFYERIAREEEYFGDEEVWLSEDFSFCYLVRQVGGNVYGYISDTLGHIIPETKYVKIPESKKWPEKSIVYFCGTTPEKWDADSIKEGIGGSEQAIINLTRKWIDKGYQVFVYCNAKNTMKTIQGVTYVHYSQFSPHDEYNILILWRKGGYDLLKSGKIVARKCILDLHDVVLDIEKIIIDRCDYVFAKSQMHIRHIKDKVPAEKLYTIPNGGAIVSSRNFEKDPNYIIYCSSYDRGIAYILKWAWPKIKKACPNAYLKIFYGWDIFDKTRFTEDNKLFKRVICDLMKQDGVEECGRISHDKLLVEKAKANIHLYTGNYQEIDCISVRESASLGVIPVVSDFVEVFREKDYCLRIEGSPSTQSMQEKTADKVIELLQNPELANEMRAKVTVPASETWASVSNKWVELMEQ
jgi:glycosyltransferase involved in cell wall biosynthesis